MAMVSTPCSAATHWTTSVAIAAVTTTANGLSSSVAARHAARPASGESTASAPSITWETSSICRPATPPFSLISATTASAWSLAMPISGARFCSDSADRSA